METLFNTYSDQLKTAMPLVSQYDERLSSLNTWWGKIALIGKINSHSVATTILDDMELTKEKFTELQDKLIQNLLWEHLKKNALEDAAKSQVAIDILIRNLFERTADVGFLATDDDIRCFLSLDRADSDIQTFIEARLNEYVLKYSVYDEIIILDPQGEVKAHLNQNNRISSSKDPLIQQTLTSTEDYVETFRHSDLQPEQQQSLIYSCKITADNSPSAKVLGVLCLCFRFDNEMASIFSNLLPERDTKQLMILDSQGLVIASSNPADIPIGTYLSSDRSLQLIRYKTDHYLTNRTQTNGYQGFLGLGWAGQMMTPINTAFGSDGGMEAIRSSQDIDNSLLFSDELKSIHSVSVNVNEDLSLVVLNGKITAARRKAVEFVPVLEEIRKIGEDTAAIFSESITNLQATVVSARLNDVKFKAGLAVDIMDRNLYERANDCRWWALTSDFRRLLAGTEVSDQDESLMSDILSYINSLYTVYTNLYLYDRNGKIQAVSNPAERRIIGQLVEDLSGAKEALLLTNSQQYAVSPFIPSSYYDGRHTYIYNAAIMDLDTSNQVVGGIGIVFDSEPQFSAMLYDTLPRDEQDKILPGSFALFTERGKKVIAATGDAPYSCGDELTLDQHFFELKNGEAISDVLKLDGVVYTVGCAVSQGYREYKTTEDYKNDVIAFVFVPF